MKLKAVFLEKDGSIITDASNADITDLNSVSLSERVVEGLQLLQSYGYLIVIVSNDQMAKVKKNIKGVCSKIGIYLDGFYRPQLLKKAAGDMDIDLSSSWMIGDLENDVEDGRNAGCRTIYIDNGKGRTQGAGLNPQYQATDLADAARYILSARN